MIDIGVIIPHFNSTKSVMKLIDSINKDLLSQNMILVVIDDKSEEDLTYLEEYILLVSNAVLIKNKTDRKGAGVCRNIGLDYLKGKTKWIIFADADDYFEENYGTVFEESLRVYKDSDIIYYNTISRDIRTGLVSDRHLVTNSLVNSFLDSSSSEDEIKLKYQHFVPWSKLFNSDLIYTNNIKFDETRVANDVMFSIKSAYHSSNIKADKSIVYCITKAPGTLTTTISEKNYITRSNILIERHNYLKKRLSKKEMRYASLYTSVWLFKGIYIYKLNKRVVLKYYIYFKKNGMKFLPPLKKIFNYKKALSIFNDGNKYKVESND